MAGRQSIASFMTGEEQSKSSVPPIGPMQRGFTEEQIIGFVRESNAGLPIKELCRKHGFGETGCYAWKAMCGGTKVSDAPRLETLEAGERQTQTAAGDSVDDSSNERPNHGRLRSVGGSRVNSGHPCVLLRTIDVGFSTVRPKR